VITEVTMPEGGLHVDFRQYRAFEDFLHGAFELVANVDGFDGHG
jgi:hypothetical protein